MILPPFLGRIKEGMGEKSPGTSWSVEMFEGTGGGSTKETSGDSTR